MVGRIREEDIAEVRERVRIEEVVGDHVTLRNAGSGSLKGLCPFHDEKSPSFHVTPSRGFFHCFGCQEGGDVITFVMKIDGLGFTDAVERLADRAGLTLRYEDGPGPNRPSGGPQRGRLLDANNKAEEFYREQLAGADAVAGRRFLHDRGFDQEAAARFGVGFAPREGEALLRHLTGLGFTPDDLVAAGLVGQGRGYYDRFRGRLMWPIRDPSGDTIGFGARRLFDDDRIEAKYLNTSETSVYRKSQVLYGLDLARREIARGSQAVIVEGYTDVMAAHLSGVGTAVATCGTAFGDDHARVLRRFLNDHEEFRGEVIFTFDGDAAGQKAALRAFEGDQNFVAQTYVAVEPGGLDPCDLRLAQGEEAVRELIARRQPLYRFVLGNVLAKYDLDRADGRVDAVREAATLVASIRDQSKVTAFAQEISRMIGADIDPNQVLEEIRRTARRGKSTPSRGAPVAAQSPAGQEQDSLGAQRRPMPDLREPRFALERENLKLMIQHPELVGALAGNVDANDFTHPVLRRVWDVVVRHGGPAVGAQTEGWAARLRDGASDPEALAAIAMLAVEPLLRAADSAYVAAHVYRLQELTVARRIAEVKSRLQRTNPVDQAVDYNRMFGELVALEQHRRTLREAAVGQQ